MCSLLSNTPPCSHACGSGDAQQRSVPHSSVHPLTLTLSPLNAEKHASLPAAVPVPGSWSSGSGLQPPATRKMADIPCQWQTRLTRSLSSLSRSISLSSFPLLPCSERSGAGAGAGGGPYWVGGAVWRRRDERKGEKGGSGG